MNKLYKKYLESRGISIDSRRIMPGNMFFALKGPNFDANQYAKEAIVKGASYAVIDDPALKSIHPRILFTNNVLLRLQQLANHHRSQFKGHVLALTGSNGKTTTKELIAAVISRKFKTHYTPGNYNNLIGLPYTILNMPEGTEFLILEMGANGPGEIAELCKIARPDSGLITNIGKAHLEGFGNIEGVKKAKSELFQSLAETNGKAFINLDENYLEELSRIIHDREFYGSKEKSHQHPLSLSASLNRRFPTLSVSYSWKGEPLKDVCSLLPGKYNYPNLITAITVGKFYGLNDQQITEGIESYKPGDNRSQWIELNSNSFFMDAYNANPSSMRASLFDFLEQVNKPAILIIGDMREVGAESTMEHQSLVNDILEFKTKYRQLWLVGSEFSKVKSGDDVLKFSDSEKAADHLIRQNFKNHLFFLKASRGIQLERIIDNLKKM